MQGLGVLRFRGFEGLGGVGIGLGCLFMIWDLVLRGQGLGLARSLGLRLAALAKRIWTYLGLYGLQGLYADLLSALDPPSREPS